jgi:RimJ/RimL family protein N-acetyltransferase
VVQQPADEAPWRIVSARLVIRPMLASDVDELVRYRNVPEVAHYQDWGLPYTVDDARSLVADSAAANGPIADRWTQLAIADGAGRTVGDLAVWLDATGQTAMIGYTLAPEQQGRGYATEAVGCLLSHLFDARTVARVAATLDPLNLASARVLERNGFRYTGTAHQAARVRGVWEDDARFELLAEEWRAWQDRTQAADVSLVEITTDNVRRVLELDRAYSQRRFVSSVAQSYGDALVTIDDDGRPITAWYRAIEADGELVGFLMLAEPSGDQPHPYLWRFLIDWRHQRRGIGRKALAELARQWLAIGATHLLLGCVAGVAGSPEPFYRSLGFEPTGQNHDGETEMSVPLERLLG